MRSARSHALARPFEIFRYAHSLRPRAATPTHFRDSYGASLFDFRHNMGAARFTGRFFDILRHGKTAPCTGPTMCRKTLIEDPIAEYTLVPLPAPRGTCRRGHKHQGRLGNRTLARLPSARAIARGGASSSAFDIVPSFRGPTTSEANGSDYLTFSHFTVQFCSDIPVKALQRLPMHKIGEALLTSAACRKRAEQKLALAESDPRHYRRLTNAAQSWLLLASGIRQLERRRSARVAANRRRTRHSALLATLALSAGPLAHQSTGGG